MPNWKKVAVSGSAASFSSLSIDTSITASIVSSSQFTGSLFGTASYASYASNGGVTQLLAGPNITLAPTNGLGQVTITANLSGSTSYNTATGSYGSFYDTTTQTNPVANIPRSMSLNTTDITNGVSISGSTNPYNTYIKTENAGVYNIQFSAQIDKTDSGADEVVIWLAKNGTNLTDSATTITLNGNNDKQVAAWNWFVNSAANDYYQIIWRSADTDLRILAEPEDTHPGIPSVIVTANRIDQFLSNTGSFSGSFTGDFTGPLFGTASQATSSSYALTASYTLQAVSSSFATTASFANSFPDQGFQYTQSIGSTTWTIGHALNTLTPLVDVYDSSYNKLIPASVVSTNINTTQITFSSAQTGYAIISKGSGVSNITAVSSSYALSSSYATNTSLYGDVVPLSISSNTASLNLATASFFTLQLVSGQNTYINPINIAAGHSVAVVLSTVGSATVSFPSSVKQPSGSLYVPTTTTGKDIITLVSFDSSNLYLTAVKNLI